MYPNLSSSDIMTHSGEKQLKNKRAEDRPRALFTGMSPCEKVGKLGRDAAKGRCRPPVRDGIVSSRPAWGTRQHRTAGHRDVRQCWRFTTCGQELRNFSRLPVMPKSLTMRLPDAMTPVTSACPDYSSSTLPPRASPRHQRRSGHSGSVSIADTLG